MWKYIKFLYFLFCVVVFKVVWDFLSQKDLWWGFFLQSLLMLPFMVLGWEWLSKRSREN